MAQDKTISDATLHYILEVIRKKFGRGAVTPNMRIALKTRKNLFDGLMVRESLEFVDNDGNALTRDLVYAVDLYTRHVKRNVDSRIFITIVSISAQNFRLSRILVSKLFC